MSGFFWLVLAVIVTAGVCITGIQPAGARSVAHTRVMGVARLVLVR
jgi:hypothetical protein